MFKILDLTNGCYLAYMIDNKRVEISCRDKEKADNFIENTILLWVERKNYEFEPIEVVDVEIT